jgi:ribonuclease P/MRP protein subunit RPP1
MKRIFTDLHLRINLTNQQATKQIVNKAKELGYHKLSIPLTAQQQDQAVNLKTTCTQVGIDFVLRSDFKPRNQEDLTHFLRKNRRKTEIICIICDNKEIARQAAKDRRVDLLNFPSLDYHKRFFDRAEAELASNALTALEIDAKPLLVLEGPPRVRMLSNLRREVAIAREFHVPVVLSSGVSEQSLMRTPRDLASLAYLFGMNETEALDTVSTNPNAIVTRNRKKLSSSFVAPGINVIKEGKTV